MTLVFREKDRQNPAKDKYDKLGQLLSQQCRAFRKEDPQPVQQKSAPACAIQEIAEIELSNIERAIDQLGASALFFEKRSCESVAKTIKNRNERKALEWNTHLFFAVIQMS